MRVYLLHYTSWPEFGGVEHVIRDQARLLTRHGHEVTILSGAGDQDQVGTFVRIPELATDFPLYAAAQTHLDRGQADQNFTKYRAVLVEALTPHLQKAELIFVHNVFTMHHNLALTQALHDLAGKFSMIAWTHDLTATNPDHSLPNPTKQPWALVRHSAPGVRYVAASQKRADEIKANLQPAPEVTVIPNGVDASRLTLQTPEILESLANLRLAERDYVLLQPARMIPRKNVEFSIEVVKKLVGKGLNLLLLITGAPDPYSPATAQYAQFIKFSLPEELKSHVVFINDFFQVDDEVLRDLYHLTDCLLYPSKQEGFGLPVLEAALHRLPVWCSHVPAFDAIHGAGCFLLDDLAKLNDAVAWLDKQPAFVARREASRHLALAGYYEKYYAPLLKS